jgi:hypothetical protein
MVGSSYEIASTIGCGVAIFDFAISKQGRWGLMRYLTKTRFKSALECVSKLRYFDNPEYDNSTKHNDFLLALAEGGHQVGALATTMLANGIEIVETDHDAQVEATLELMKRDEVVIFEATIRSGRFFIRIDLLHKQGNLLRLYEVKAKSFDSSPHGSKVVGAKGQILSEFKPYLYDVAFQRHVVRACFPEMNVESFLVMPDKSTHTTQPFLTQRLPLTRNGTRVRVSVDQSLADGVAAREILYTLPVDALLDTLVADKVSVSGQAVSFVDALEIYSAALDAPPAPFPSASCSGCEFFTDASSAGALKDGRHACWSTHFGLAESQLGSTVFDLYGFTPKRTDAVVASGRVRLQDLNEIDVDLKEEPGRITQTHRQWLQCLEANGDHEPLVRKADLSKKLADLRYPIHFIDFETARSPLPFQPGKRPYELVLFQFSHHVVSADGAISHASEHLDIDTISSPSLGTMRALMNALSGDEGSVLHWWDYERTVLSEMKKQILAASDSEAPDRGELVAFIDSLIDGGRLVDLGRKITHETVFMPGTDGSSSIKLFLPALLEHTPATASKFAEPIYGARGGIASRNFTNHQWVQRDADGRVIDPYNLLDGRFEDADLADAEKIDDEAVISNGGAAMVAYGLAQSGSLDAAASERLKKQLLRYCELDTLAMVICWEGLREMAA